MTEAEWLVGDDPLRMLEFAAGRAGDRKLRLFLHACAARVLDLARVREISRWGRRECLAKLEDALRTVERFADGLYQSDALEAARRAAQDAVYVPSYVDYGGESLLDDEASVVVCAAARRLTGGLVVDALRRVLAIFRAHRNAGTLLPSDEQPSEVARWLRDVVGNPFRPVAAAPSWLAWNDGTVVKMAESIYATGAFVELPLLADALEDAGCADASILDHLRGPGPHVRGCWALDLFIAAPRRFAYVAACPEPAAPSRASVSEPPPQLRPGDWLCPECQAHNFAKRDACMKCKRTRPAPMLREGDWICPGCQAHNFARRTSCHQCKAGRPS